MKKKVIMNIHGLGYPSNDIEFLENIEEGKEGYHHVKYMISILKNTFSIDTNVQGSVKNGYISLSPLSNFIKSLYNK